MSIRAATIIIGLLLIAVIAFLLFNFISAFFRNDKIITITKDATFDPTELRVDNNQTVKIKNDDESKHEVVTKDTNRTLVIVDSKKTSDKLDLSTDTIYDLTLSENSDANTKIFVGSPEETESTSSADLSSIPTPSSTPTVSSTPTTTRTPTPTPTKVATTSGTNKPLPGTGPEDDLKIFLLTVIGGILLFKYSKGLRITG